MATIATKEQERAALAKIKKIIEDLGPDSYVGTAFKGCFDDAEENIEKDFALSMYDRWQYAENNYERAKEKIKNLATELDKLEAENKRLSADVERLQEWKPYEDSRNVSQVDYKDLAEKCEHISDEKAIDIISKWFGFVPEKVEIIHEVNLYEANKEHHLRKAGTVNRDPLFEVGDMNYIRFNVCREHYELHNGDLRLFYD